MLPAPRLAASTFVQETAAAKKILVIEVAGLGDLVHSLPAMWAIRTTYPDAELHCLVRREHVALLTRTPWIDRVWPYRRSRILDPRIAFDTIASLRRQRFDVAIDLMGSDHASAAAWLSGAPRRLVRRPGVRRMRLAWRWAATDLMVQPFAGAPMYVQRWSALAQAGIETREMHFALEKGSPGAARAIDPGDDPLVHVSPFTKRTSKELPPQQLAALLNALHERLPGARFVVSCGGNARERETLDELLAALSFEPARVFRGELDVAELFDLIAAADLHLSGDTGSAHLAWLAGTPSVTWMSSLGNVQAWAPVGSQHKVVCSGAPVRRHLLGIATDEIVAASVELVRGFPRGARGAGIVRPGRADGARAPALPLP